MEAEDTRSAHPAIRPTNLYVVKEPGVVGAAVATFALGDSVVVGGGGIKRHDGVSGFYRRKVHREKGGGGG